MKKLLTLLCMLIMIALIITGCKNQNDISTNINSNQTEEKTNTATDIPIKETAIAEDETAIDDMDKDNEEILEVIDGELRVVIDVYVNDELMDVTVYKNVDKARSSQAYNLADFTLAKPIMDLLGITYSIDESNDKITLTSDKYGITNWSYSSDVRIIEDNLYIAFNLFNLHTNGSLKQDDSSAMYLYTSDYERTDLPATLEECYAMLDEELNAEDIEFMKNSTEEDRIMMHFGFGMWIRNKWLYPTQSKIAELLYENGVRHIDDMSAIIIEGYVLYLNNEPCSLDDLLP